MAAGAGVVLYSIVMIRRIQSARAAIREARNVQPFMRSPRNARQHILVLGDSTMYGAGIKDSAKTMGGLLAASHPYATVETRALIGAKIEHLESQIGRASHRHYDLVVIGVGANDVIYFSDYRKAEATLRVFLASLNDRADKIVLMHCMNIGNAGFFLPPLSYMLDRRTRLLSQMYTRVTRGMPNVVYVNFYRPRRDDFYDRETRPRFLADDGFHPSDYANQFFYQRIESALSSVSS